MQNVASLLNRLSRLCNLAKNFQLEFSKTPLKKTVCFVMGEQSSGKSSFINYFLHDLPVRQTGAQAIDSHFTIIETVSEREFEMLCKQSNRTYVKNSTSTPCWDERLPKQFFNKEKFRQVEELDDRYGRIWIDLTPLQKSTRYKQFFDGEMKEILYTNHELLQAIVVNEKYIQCTELESLRKDKLLALRREELRKKEEEKAKQKLRDEEMKKLKPVTVLDNCLISDYMEAPPPDDETKAYLYGDNFIEEEELYRPLVKDVIFIDSPGFNDDSLLEDVEKFKCFVNMLEFFYKQASLCLFLLSPDHMKSIGNSLKILQLTVLDYETKSKLFEEAHAQIKQTNDSKSGNQEKSGSSSLVKMVLSGALDILESKAKTIMKTMIPIPLPSFPGSRKPKQNKTQNYRFIGPSLYEKLYFVINKIDLCENEHSAFFELGVSMGKHFKHLPVPNSNHILTCGCPMEQRYSKKNLWKVKSFPSMEILNNFFTEQVVSIPMQELSVGQLQQVEELMQQLRSPENVQKSILNHMRYILEKMEVVFNEWNIVTRFRQNGEIEEARKLCSF